MPALNRVLFNVLCKDLSGSVAFYRQLLDLETTYESDWFVTLSPKGQPHIEIGLIDQVSQFTPRHAWGMHEGTYLTFVVDDVYDVLDRARALGAEVVAEPVALDYGQTRGLIRDLNGMVLDISTPTADLQLREDVVLQPDEMEEGGKAERPETAPNWADFHPERAH
jgi:predicted enzyme related to lactoylglutathione lyase